MPHDLDDLTSYTHIDRHTCLNILDEVQRECGEIGNVSIEDMSISFEVYGGYFDRAPTLITGGDFTLKLTDKFDDPFFTLVYRIQIDRAARKSKARPARKRHKQ